MLSATETLRRSAKTIESPLRAAVAQLPEPLRTGTGFHFGWCDDTGQRISALQGKMIRPAFVLSATRLTGEDLTDAAVRAGVAVELVHNFSLVHDDVVDDDRTRRGRPTIWARFGVPHAIFLGGAMLSLANQVLAQGRQSITAELCLELNAAVVALSAGQNLDVEFEKRLLVSKDEYLEMVAGKTAALISAACVLGGLAGGAAEGQVAALRRFGHHVGLAFQLVDDILGIFGDSAVTGKPVGADLLRYKKSLPALAAMGSRSDAGYELLELYRTRAITRDVLDHAVHLVASAGGRECAEAEAARQHTLALRCLEDSGGQADAIAELSALADLMVNRNR